MPKLTKWISRSNKSKLGWLKTAGPVLVVLLIAAVAAPWLIGPACPQHIVIATGSSEGAYFAFANRYREILAKDGITLEVRSTAGSIENYRLLHSDDNDVSLALIQGGIASSESRCEIESLASLYLEPVWVFHRGRQPVEQLSDLRGKRIAVGVEGSGTRAVALQLLGENNLVAASDSEPSTSLLPFGGREAADALKQGRVDAAFFVISPQSPIVRELLEADGIELMSFRRAAAYERKYPFLSSVTLSEGMLDLKRNLPDRDIVLLAPTANLVARKGLHSALVPLLLAAVTQVHEGGGFLEQPGVFPSSRHVDAPMNDDSKRYLKSGPSFFYRYLPFGLAAWLDRVKLVLLPLCTLLFPFLKAAPPIYRWRIRSKIYRWYRVLREVDQTLRDAVDRVDVSAEIARLTKLERELGEVTVPLSYMEEFYNLRLHVSFVLSQLAKLEQLSAEASQRAA